MSKTTIVPVILSGGSGTRLWPLSTPQHPKQFHSLVTGNTLFQDAVLRSNLLDSASPPIVVCNDSHRELVRTDLSSVGIEPAAILLEPCARNTAPAIAAAALVALREFNSPDLLVSAADHVIRDQAAFAESVVAASEAARKGRLVTFGIVPNRPETGYGYILKGESHGNWAELSRFVEKPDLRTAEEYVASGQYLWNSGMFMMPAELYLDELNTLEPGIFAAVTRAVNTAVSECGLVRLGESFANSPSNSIDYAVMEKTRKAAVVSLDAGWSDVGSWSALREAQVQDDLGNVIRGDVVALNVSRSFVIANGKRVAISGLEDIVVVETEDTILITSTTESQSVKSLMALCSQAEAEKK